jgi:hypothetical protein
MDVLGFEERGAGEKLAMAARGQPSHLTPQPSQNSIPAKQEKHKSTPVTPVERKNIRHSATRVYAKS